MKRIILTLCLLALSLAGCAADPRRAADADATRLLAEQQAADAEQAREQQADIHAMEIETRKAAQAEWQSAINKVIHTAAVFGQVTVALWMLSLGAAGVWTMLGTSRAYSIWIENKANQIPLDKSTRQFPLLIYKGAGMYTLTNPNDNSVLLLDTHKPADLAKVKAMANVQYAGALGQEAKWSSQPGVAQIPASQQIVDMESER